MTSDEIRIVEALALCQFAPGTSQKQFVRQMDGRDRTRPLTERQRAYLWAIAWSWRRQLPRCLADLAYRYSGGVGTRGRQINAERLRTAYADRAQVDPAPARATAPKAKNSNERPPDPHTALIA